MKYEEIPESFKKEYKEICTCGNQHIILTEISGDYTTFVYIKCECGNFIEFELPCD